MYNKLIVIPARANSKGILNKNIVSLSGKPLIQWTLESLSEFKKNARICISTDSPEIQNLTRTLGFEIIFTRPDYLATDTASTLDVIKHAKKSCEEYYKEKYDYIITLQPTSPLRSDLHILNAIDEFEKNPFADSLVSCTELPHNFNPESIMKLGKNGYLIYDKNNSFNRHLKSKYLARNGAAIYITKSDILENGLLGEKCIPFKMKKTESIDIDDNEDLKIAEAILKSIHKSNS